MNFKNKKCLILGGAGFIGMNLSLMLKEKDMDVYVLDSLSNNYIQAIQILDKNNIKFLHANALDINYIVKNLKYFNYVVNLVSTGIIDDGFTNQEDLVDASILCSQILIQAATHHNVSKIILTSNLHVYGETKPYRSKCKETMTNLQPICPLGSIKLSEEMIAKTLAKAYDQKITVLRLAECYGEYMKTHMPYSSFMSTALSCITGTECTLPNDGLDGRDYVYVKDVCKYITSILFNDNKNLFEIYNICSGQEKTYKDIFDYMKNYFKNKQATFQNRMVIYPFAGHIIGNNSKIKKDFGDQFSSFDESIQTTLLWIENQLKEQQQIIENAKQLVQQES